MELWATYTIDINGNEIQVVARNYDDALEQAKEKYV